jgi:hypothetical protein
MNNKCNLWGTNLWMHQIWMYHRREKTMNNIKMQLTGCAERPNNVFHHLASNTKNINPTMGNGCSSWWQSWTCSTIWWNCVCTTTMVICNPMLLLPKTCAPIPITRWVGFQNQQPTPNVDLVATNSKMEWIQLFNRSEQLCHIN